jgi:Gnt-I system low-affinity gluconate transporter
MSYILLPAVLFGIALLLFLIVKAKWPAFIALLTVSIAVGLLAGMPADVVVKSIEKGMGGTLGYVATIVGLGSILGGILEKSGGSQVIARTLLQWFGLNRASTAMAVAGFVIAIPVFFDVAFIILYPVLGALQRKTGKSVLFFALPLLAGLAVGHAFVPPTPGPIAVANILGADLGWVILSGMVVGFPTALVAGVWAGRRLAAGVNLDRLVAAPEEETPDVPMPSVSLVMWMIFLPIGLILMNTCIQADLWFVASEGWKQAAGLAGHPFTALLLANILAWYLLGRRMGYSTAELGRISTQSFQSAGVIILLTGAGGAFKQILVDTGAGEMMARSAEDAHVPILVLAFLMAAIIRVLQGSATVAMATAAGIIAPLVTQSGISGLPLACIVTAIASGASILSHVNDSGFWLVKEYLGLTERQTFRSWTAMTTVLGVCGFLLSWGLYLQVL